MINTTAYLLIENKKFLFISLHPLFTSRVLFVVPVEPVLEHVQIL